MDAHADADDGRTDADGRKDGKKERKRKGERGKETIPVGMGNRK